MASNGKPGHATRLGRFLGAVIIAAAVVATGYWWSTRPKAERSPEPTSTTTMETTAPMKVEAPVVHAEVPQASSPAPVLQPVEKQQTGESNDPYGNLSIKEIRK